MKVCRDCGTKNVGIYCSKCGGQLYTGKTKKRREPTIFEMALGLDRIRRW